MTEPSLAVEQQQRPARFSASRRPWLLPCTLLAIAALLFGWYEADKHWPYRYRNVEPLLQKVFASQIKIDHYSRIYFPHPGFVAQGITLRRNTAPDLPPLGSAQTLLVQGSWGDLLLLRRRVLLVEVKGMHVVIPPVGSRANKEDFPAGSSADFTGPTTTVEQLHLIDANLDLMRDVGERLRFPIRDLKIRGLQRGRAVTFTVEMDNARPTGRIQASGSFGPLNPQSLGATALAGRFRFAPVNLGDIGNLHGTLSSDGEFSGSLDSIEAKATSTTPNFAVGTGTPVKVDGVAQATINGLNGDVVLHRIEARTGPTLVEAAGAITGSPKVAEIDLNVTRGRAEDLLQPFLESRPPITGVVWLKSHAHIDPAVGGAQFLQRLHMDGTFRVPSERLTDRKKQKSLSAFSERAQGGTETAAQASANPAADVLSSVEGTARMQDGVLLTRSLGWQRTGAPAPHPLLLRVDAPDGDPEILARTLDDAAGEAFDKGARMLGLGYPGGAALQRLARGGDPTAFAFPSGRSDDFSFAGLKTALLYKLRDLELDYTTDRPAPAADGEGPEEGVRADLAASFQAAIVRALVGRVEQALERTGLDRLAIGGGVAANGPLRERLAGLGVRLSLPPLELCTDNAAMIASAARYVPARRYPDYLSVEAYATGEGPLR